MISEVYDLVFGVSIGAGFFLLGVSDTVGDVFLLAGVTLATWKTKTYVDLCTVTRIFGRLTIRGVTINHVTASCHLRLGQHCFSRDDNLACRPEHQSISIILYRILISFDNFTSVLSCISRYNNKIGLIYYRKYRFVYTCIQYTNSWNTSLSLSKPITGARFIIYYPFSWTRAV